MKFRFAFLGVVAGFCLSANSLSQELAMPYKGFYGPFLNAALVIEPQAGPMQPCPQSALDITFEAAEYPDHTYALAMNKQNISAETCYLFTRSGGVWVTPNQAPDGSRIKVCYNCETRQQKSPTDRVILAPGEFAHQMQSWKSIPPDASTSCVTATSMSWEGDRANGSIRLSSPSFLRPICSPLVSTDNIAGRAFAVFKTSSRTPVIEWDNAPDTSYSLQNIPLRVKVKDPGDQLLLDKKSSCPRLFLRTPEVPTQRGDPTSDFFEDEIPNPTCTIESAASKRKPSAYAMEFDASAVIAEDHENNGEFRFNVSALAEEQGRYSLIGISKDFHLSMVNGKLLVRDWGPTTDGLAASLILDKESYQVGEEIPLHIALQNISSPSLITASNTPRWFISVKLVDFDNQPVASTEEPITGNGAVCYHFYRGNITSVTMNLSWYGFRPQNPGLYKVVATWSPGKDVGCGFATLSSKSANIRVEANPVTLRLAPKVNVKPIGSGGNWR